MAKAAAAGRDPPPSDAVESPPCAVPDALEVAADMPGLLGAAADVPGALEAVLVAVSRRQQEVTFLSEFRQRLVERRQQLRRQLSQLEVRGGHGRGR